MNNTLVKKQPEQELPELAFDDLEGKLLVGIDAINAHVERGGTFVPLARILTVPYFPYDGQQFDPLPRRRWCALAYVRTL